MPRYSDLDKLQSKMQRNADLYKGCNDADMRARRDEALNAVACVVNAPTVDAVEVVRCKDCKHWKPSGAEAGNLFENMEPIGGCIYANFFRKASEFCSRGERRNDG